MTEVAQNASECPRSHVLGETLMRDCLVWFASPRASDSQFI